MYVIFITIYSQLLQFLYRGRKYIRSIENYIDLLSYVLAIYLVISPNSCQRDTGIRTVSMANEFFYTRLSVYFKDTTQLATGGTSRTMLLLLQYEVFYLFKVLRLKITRIQAKVFCFNLFDLTYHLKGVT